jgi:hypothetical protein
MTMFRLTDEEKKLLASKRKNMQIVWVPLSVLDEMAQIAEKLHLALNQTIIVLAIRALRGFPQQTNNDPAHFLCPICLQSFSNPSDFLTHLKGDENVEIKPHI